MTVKELISELQELLEQGKIKDNTPIQVWNLDIADYTSCFEVLFTNKQVYLE